MDRRWTPPVTLSSMADIEPVVKRWFAGSILTAGQMLCGIQGVRIVSEGLENLSGGMCLLAHNHVHYYDWLPVRLVMYRELSKMCSNFIKPRAYQKPAVGRFLRMSGSVPIASRGYVITADFRSLHGRRPDEQEYRYLRNVVDGLEVDAPNSVALEAVLRENRDVLGRSFDAASSSYADVVHEVFEGFMEQSSRLIGSSMSQGCWPIIAPQGTFHSRLTPGRIGAVQLALRLGVPIIPVGVGGMRAAFANGHSLRGRPATITVRFGAPLTIELPPDHQPFHVQSERQNRDTLQRETHRVMTCINAMLPERCQWGDDVNGDGLQGVNRFL